MSAELKSIDTASVVSNYLPEEGKASVFLTNDNGTLKYKAKKHDGTIVDIGGGGGGSSTPPASQVTITDSGSYYTSTNVEGALQEVGTILNGLQAELEGI